MEIGRGPWLAHLFFNLVATFAHFELQTVRYYIAIASARVGPVVYTRDRSTGAGEAK